MSADVQQAPAISSDKGDNRASKDPLHRRPSFHLIHKRQKEDIKQCRYCRKRSQRFCYHDKHGCSGPAVKRRKKDLLIPPTKFLLGGNIRDPLNLNSLRDEEVNRRLNAVTPETSPMPTPQWKKGEVEVLLPPNIHDPLNLEGSQSPPVYGPTPSLRKSRKKHKKKKQRSSTEQQISEDCSTESCAGAIPSETNLNTSGSDCGGEDSQTVASVATEANPVVETKEPQPELEPVESVAETVSVLPPPAAVVQVPPPPPIPPNTLALPKFQDIHLNKKGKGSSWKKVVDKIVSPVVKQPGACGTNNPRRKLHINPLVKPGKPQSTPNFKESNKKYQYGNYNRYYGYRNADYDMDPRLRLLEMRRDMFYGKEVLDIGCNTGHITLAIASEMGANRVVGLDLDRRLVEAARANIKHYVRRSTGQPYPVSMPLIYGPLPVVRTDQQQTFPHNVSFIQGNYVLSSDVLLELETQQFDTILCLSVTKWFHLNWGDDGLKRAFRRMYAQLRPGGVLVLEPQPWSSYKKKKNITETTWTNYQAIELFPQKFTQFLLSEVGFTKCEILGAPVHNSRGFQRPIKIYTKGDGRRRHYSDGSPDDSCLMEGQTTVVEQSETEDTAVSAEVSKQTDRREDRLVSPSLVKRRRDETGVFKVPEQVDN